MRTLRPLRRSSSRIQRWVQDQQKRHSGGESVMDGVTPDDDRPSVASGCHPWLAYPRLSVPLFSSGGRLGDGDDQSTVESYVLVDEEELDTTPNDDEPHDALQDVTEADRRMAVDLTSPPSTPRKRQSTITITTPLRNLALHLTHNRRFSASTTATARSRSPSRSSIFQRTPANKGSPSNRGSSLASSVFTHRRERSSDVSSTSPSSWRLTRGSVLGRLAPPSQAAVDEAPPRPSISSYRTRASDVNSRPRQSISSSRTLSSETAPISPPRRSMSSSRTPSSETSYTRPFVDTCNAPQKVVFAPRERPPSPSASFFSATQSLWSLPADASHMCDPPGSTKIIAHDRSGSGSVLIPLSLKGHANVSSFTVTNMLSSPRGGNKRKLVISGIPPGDQRRYEKIREWCEGFGELNQIIRIPNGDLHIDFKRTEVAATVSSAPAVSGITAHNSIGLSPTCEGIHRGRRKCGIVLVCRKATLNQ
ncbi:hypothetical protein PHLCEN_2v2737 [Hermanssonia centrifuga]|uniref:Uncharacterized protein n=1 Tax=Hermanssonia centrifuga TaxID=98765 RepID=A0A2R6RHV0_9APHY|nr:hypothetical protein PHLCEN_2v2737 [Hermanssonia centrifuga]